MTKNVENKFVPSSNSDLYSRMNAQSDLNPKFEYLQKWTNHSNLTKWL